MKTIKQLAFSLAVLLSIFSYTDALAQHGRAQHGKAHHGYQHSENQRPRYQRSNRHQKYQVVKRQRNSYYHARHAYHNRPVTHYLGPIRHAYYGRPVWAAAHHYNARHHVYFRDYCTFYDPYRGGYVYWSSNRWLFSPSVPAFLAGVDLSHARIQLMADIPLDRHPEYYYDEYARVYPRNSHISINVSLPL